jgi:hypothetical protein
MGGFGRGTEGMNIKNKTDRGRFNYRLEPEGSWGKKLVHLIEQEMQHQELGLGQ